MKMAFLKNTFKLQLERNYKLLNRTMSGKKLIPSDLITGKEKRELKEEEAGNCDPYGLSIKRGPGTKDKPTLIPSAFSARMVGCVCPDECSNINWMWVHKGEPKRCGCGHWFKLVEIDPV